MANSASFVQYVLDLLSPVAPVTTKSMFGVHGLSSNEVMFGLLDDGELFFRTDEQTQPKFVAAECKKWVYSHRKTPMKTEIYAPPPEAMESTDAIRPWFELALAAASRRAAVKTKKKKPAAKRARK